MIAFNKNQLQKLEIWLFAKKLQKDGFIAEDKSLSALEEETSLYHPGLFMRIFLFVVGLVGGIAVIGLVLWIIRDSLDKGWKIACIALGISFLVFLETVLIKKLSHFKTGFTEAILYMALALLSVGLSGYFNDWFGFVIASLLCLVAAIRYIDTLLGAIAMVLFALSLLLLAEEIGGWATLVLPFFIIILYSLFYRYSLKFEKPQYKLWFKPTYAIQAICLAMAYAGGNYFVVRELNRALNDVYLEPGENIAFAWFFYAFTVLVPVFYLYWGVIKRNRIFIWVGMIAAGFGVFTFKYYYSLGHPEVTLTISGLVVLGIAYTVLSKLKKPRKGVTREQISQANLDFLTAEGVLISQMAAGAAAPEAKEDMFGGGQFGGGGASGNID